MAEEDLLFGKNRHLFGGIAPGNMYEFHVTWSSVTKKDQLVIALPKDTVIDGQTVCSVAGVVVRKRNDHYPVDEFDGDLVIDTKTDIVWNEDTGSASGTVMWYYSAFPYSTQGVYNRNEKNRASRRLTGNVGNLLAQQVPKLAGVSLVAKPPTPLSFKLVKNTTHLPVDENDGELLKEGTTTTSYADMDVVMGETYYYRMFVNLSGMYDRDYKPEYDAIIHIRDYEYLFGYDLDTNNPDPDTRVTYPNDVDNAAWTPAFMNYSTDKFDYGGWVIASTPGTYFMPRPCTLVRANGTLHKYLNPSNYALNADGSSSDITSINHPPMMEWPKIYTKRWEEDGIYKFRCSDKKHDSDWECWCNYATDTTAVVETDKFYTSIYPLCNSYYSVSGQVAISNVNINGLAETIQSTQGPGYFPELLCDTLLIQDLLVMMAKTTNSQKAYGSSSFAGTNVANGGGNTKGMFYGRNGFGNQGYKVFGMENYLGIMDRAVTGITYHSSGRIYIKITRSIKDGSNSTTDFIPSTNNIRLDQSPSVGDVGYISKCVTTKFGRIPVLVGGSSGTYETDFLSVTTTNSFACFGGNGKDMGLKSGAFSLTFDTALVNNTRSSTICFLSYKPSPKT